MVIDTSAIVAILLDEPDAPQLAKAIEAAPIRRISAATLLEASLVLEKRFGFSGGAMPDRLLAMAAVQTEPVTAEQAAIARVAFRSYGKGRHPAGHGA